MKSSPSPNLFVLIFLFIFSSFLLFNQCSREPEKFFSPHFTIEEISDGIYVALHKAGGYAICNAGIVDLGDETLIFDTFLTPMAATDLKEAAESLTGNKVKYVINSHFHNDHIRGNQVFTEASIISTKTTRELIREYESHSENDERSYAPGRLKELKQEYNTATDSVKKNEILMWIGYFEGMIESHKTLNIVLPDSIFIKELSIKGKSRSVRLTEYHYGHTRNDIIMTVDKENIIFTGDLMFVNYHPYLPDGNPDSLIVILNKLSEEDFEFIVPGHGPIGRSSDIRKLADYVIQLKQISKKLLKSGSTSKNSYQQYIPTAYAHWQFPNFFDYNIKFMLNNAMNDSN